MLNAVKAPPPLVSGLTLLHVLQGVLRLPCADGVGEVLRQHIHRRRRLDQRDIDVGGAGRGLCAEAFHRTAASLTGHLDRPQLQRPVVPLRCHQRHRIRIGEPILQPGAGKQLLQRLVDTVSPVQPRAGFALGQVGGADEEDACLAGEAGQHPGQWAGGNSVLTHLVRRGLGRRRAVCLVVRALGLCRRWPANTRQQACGKRQVHSRRQGQRPHRHGCGPGLWLWIADRRWAGCRDGGDGSMAGQGALLLEIGWRFGALASSGWRVGCRCARPGLSSMLSALLPTQSIEQAKSGTGF